MARILLIDDSEDLRAMLGDELVAAGYEVTAVANGHAGLAAVREAHVDVVVTDIFMPERDGLETIAELRRDFPRIKVIAISGGGSRLRNQRTDHLAIAPDRLLVFEVRQGFFESFNPLPNFTSISPFFIIMSII